MTKTEMLTDLEKEVDKYIEASEHEGTECTTGDFLLGLYTLIECESGLNFPFDHQDADEIQDALVNHKVIWI